MNLLFGIFALLASVCQFLNANVVSQLLLKYTSLTTFAYVYAIIGWASAFLLLKLGMYLIVNVPIKRIKK